MVFDPKPHLIQLPRRVKHRTTGQYVTVFDDYLEVRWRVLMFRERYPHGRIITEEIQVDLDRGYARYKAVVEDGEGGQATGYGTETQADFGDFCERAETRAIGRALALAGFGTAFVSVDLTEGEHVADAPVASTNGQGDPLAPDPQGPISPEARISRDQARELKKVAQTAYGFAAGERRLREDLGLEAGTPITLMRLEAHVTPARYAVLIQTYEGDLKAEVEADVSDHAPPALETATAIPVTTGQPVSGQPSGEAVTGDVTTVTLPSHQPPTLEVDDHQRWYRLSRRSMRAGLSPTVWERLRAGDYASAKRVILALEQQG